MKINVGASAPRKMFHNLSHDVSTTSNFGFCQPILQRELIGQDSVSLRIGTICRLQPLVTPTFGDIKVKTYSSFVRMDDIWHPFDNFKLGKPYKGSSLTSYVPEYVPSVSCNYLYAWLVRNSRVTGFKVSTTYFDGYFEYDPTNSQGETSLMNDTDLALFDNAFDSVFDDEYNFKEYVETLHSLGFHEYALATDAVTLLKMTSLPDNLDGFDWILPYHDADNSITYYFCGKFKRAARLLRKVLLGLGYQLNMSTERVSALPIWAYYKVYFDLFGIQRDMTWKDTAAYSVMEYLEQNGLSNIPVVDNSNAKKQIAQFFANLSACFYTINPDYASAHITGVSISSAESGIVHFLDEYGNDQNVMRSSINGQAESSVDTSSVGRKIQDIMTVYLNKVTAIGGKLGVAMRALYHEDYDGYDSTYLGSQQTPIQIGPVFANNESDDVTLGEYRGQGIGTSQGDKLQFIAKHQGFLITLMCVVPDAKMSQGVDPMLFHVKRWDYFANQVDAKTLLPTSKKAIYGNQELLYPSQKAALDSGFGNIPNYTEYKIKNNIINGDMSLPSTRATYLPFTLDKLLPYRDWQDMGQDITLYRNLPASYITCGNMWRYVGLLNWFGNFDRIFVNSGTGDNSVMLPDDEIDDNFVIQNFVELKVHSFAKPLADSFETGASEDATVDVQKA